MTTFLLAAAILALVGLTVWLCKVIDGTSE